jgi:hypothetical protein
VSGIILTDAPGTFADESYGDNPKRDTVMVLGELKGNVDLTWHAALLAKVKKQEIKWGQFRQRQDALPPELVKSVYVGMRSALIVISDDREYRATYKDALEESLKVDLSKLAPDMQEKLVTSGNPWVDRMVLVHSPLWEVNAFLGGDEVRDDFDEHVKYLENSRNVRFLATRVTSAFFETIDPDEDGKTPGVVDPERWRLSAAITPVRTFDRGNEKVTNVIRGLRQQGAGRLYDADGVEIGTAAVTEASSKESRHVGAGDLAAGYARDLYLSADGLNKVRDAFDLVVLNGEVLRR